MQPRLQPSRRIRQGGSVYVMVLVVSMIVTVVGLASITRARIQTRQSVGANDWAQAQIVAFSAAEHALSVVDEPDGKWRELYIHNAEAETFSLGQGTAQWKLLDEIDANLEGSASDPVVIIATGVVGQARYKLRIELTADGATMKIIQGSWQQVVD